MPIVASVAAYIPKTSFASSAVMMTLAISPNTAEYPLWKKSEIRLFFVFLCRSCDIEDRQEHQS
jgi:hypothetical protein